MQSMPSDTTSQVTAQTRIPSPSTMNDAAVSTGTATRPGKCWNPCDHCRLKHIGCDSATPCRNCAGKNAYLCSRSPPRSRRGRRPRGATTHRLNPDPSFFPTTFNSDMVCAQQGAGVPPIQYHDGTTQAHGGAFNYGAATYSRVGSADVQYHPGTSYYPPNDPYYYPPTGPYYPPNAPYVYSPENYQLQRHMPSHVDAPPNVPPGPAPYIPVPPDATMFSNAPPAMFYQGYQEHADVLPNVQHGPAPYIPVPPDATMFSNAPPAMFHPGR
ncbi:hypothetical protein C8Q70DRAFT_100180 [Cubamyces menziesii]|nr:hypothetical protein C8Q70DRAFT_100180 [Cubamyces menziesii]